MQEREQDRSSLSYGPIKGAHPPGTRDNRDLSEGLEKSRSNKLGAFAPIQIETQSQKDTSLIQMQQSHLMGSESQANTKCSKQDTSDSAIFPNANNKSHNLSHSDMS